MSVRALDANGDWTFGRGRNNYKTRNDEVAQCVQCNILTFLGECFFNIEQGIDWFNLLGSKNIPALQLAITTTILNTENVVKINSLTVTLTAERAFNLSYNLDSIYTNVAAPDTTVSGNTNYLLTESGVVITTEDGSPIVVT